MARNHAGKKKSPPSRCKKYFFIHFYIEKLRRVEHKNKKKKGNRRNVQVHDLWKHRCSVHTFFFFFVVVHFFFYKCVVVFFFFCRFICFVCLLCLYILRNRWETVWRLVVQEAVVT